MRRVSFAALVAASVLLGGDRARAGDRVLEVLFVNMTPDAAVTPEARVCVREIEAVVRKDYTHILTVGERATRKAAGKLDGAPILEWPGPALAAVAGGTHLAVDTVILADCRPASRTLDLVVFPASSAIVRLQLRRVPIDGRAARFMGEMAMGRAWAGFSP